LRSRSKKPIDMPTLGGTARNIVVCMRCAASFPSRVESAPEYAFISAIMNRAMSAPVVLKLPAGAGPTSSK
jgi:hypothetical protein